jgi:ribosome maturation factor RimP
MLGCAAVAENVNSDERFVRETGVAGQIAELAEPVINELGLRLVRVSVSGRDGCTVQVMIERPGGTVVVDDCAEISRQLSPLLDVHDPISGAYKLEVSSPGLDRPLVRFSDFELWTGYEAKVELREMIDGRKRFRGVIEGFEDGEIRLQVKLEGYSQEQIIGLPVHLVESAKLVVTDALIQAALAGGKANKA